MCPEMLGSSYQVTQVDSGDGEDTQPAPTGNATRSNVPEPAGHQDNGNVSQPEYTSDDATLEPTDDAQTREVRPVKCLNVTFTDQYSPLSSHMQRVNVHAS